MNDPVRLIAFFLFIATGSLCAQNLITSYSVEEGLPQSTVMSLYRDDDGYLWCGTGAGLALYDGWDFHTPVTDAEKANPNLNSPVRGIIPSPDLKTMWVGTESVLMQFDRFSYRVLRSYDVVKTAGAAEVPVVANDTAVWVICWGQGLYRVRISDGRITRLTSNSFHHQHGLTTDKQTIVFPDSTGSLIAYNLLTNSQYSIPIPDKLRGVTTGSILSKPDAPDELIMVSSIGLWTVDLRNKSITRFVLGDPDYDETKWDFRALAFHPDGSWWMAIMDRGVFRYDPLTKKVRPCLWQQDGTFAGDLLKSPKSIVCDAYGVVWLATDGVGIVKMLHNRITFRNKFTSPVVTDTCNWFVRSFFELSDERFLVGTFRNGIQLVDEKSGVVRHVTLDGAWNQQTPMFMTGTGEGRLLVGTENNLFLLDTITWKITSVNANSNSVDQRYIGYLRLNTGQVLVYGNTGVHEVLFGPLPQLSENWGKYINATSAVQLSDGRIIVGTYYEGLEELTADGTFRKFYSYESHIGIPKTTLPRGMFEDSSHNLWIGSQSGLYKLSSGMKLSQVFVEGHGLPDKTIYDIAPLNENTIVVTTGHGIVIYDLNKKVMRTYVGADGLPSEECNTGALLYAPSGQLYVGTTEGFVHWNPMEAVTCFRSSSILASFEGTTPGQPGIIRESIVRDYGSGSVDLRIWLTDFAFPERAWYSYQLEGATTDRTKEQGLHKVNYAALNSGFYSFLCSVDIPGCGETGIQKLLTIKIVPPFWMSGWFIAMSSLGAVLILTLVLFIVMRMNYQRKLRKMRMQQALDKVRARISRDIHDEIGAGLTRIALSGELMSAKATEDVHQQEKLKWIAGTARELSQSMKEVVWSVNPHYDSLDHMSAYFRSYVAGVAENAELRFRYIADENIPAEEVNPETRRNLLLILKESVSNAVKYSGCKELKLEIRWRNDQLTMKISDDGKGFDLDSTAGVNSNGLRNIRQRAEASQCTIAIHSSSGNGTVIVVTGPISEK